MWLFFALAAPFFWALVHVLDEYCVDHVLEEPWMGVVTSAFASLIVYLIIPFVLPGIDWQSIQISWIATAFFVGVLIQLSQFFYFTALSYSEAGIVAAYWNFVPALLPIFGFFVFHDILSVKQYIGIFVLIFASTSLCFLDFHHKTRMITVVLMLLAALFQVAAYILMTAIYLHLDFIFAYLVIVTGLIFCGLLPLLAPRIRKSIFNTFYNKGSLSVFFLVIELANLMALGCAQMAIKLGDASLVAAVETTIPAFVFFLSIFWVRRMDVSSEALFDKLGLKIIIVTTMVFGVWMVS